MIAVKIDQQTTKYGHIRNSALPRLWRGIPIILGPGIVVFAILWVHATGLIYHLEDYAEAPPTISRALLVPGIAGPFAIAMIASAILIAIAVFQVGLLLFRNMKLIGQDTGWHTALLLAAVTCEMIAIAGMVVLSQFPGNLNSNLHEIGSYMLFFGHALGLSLAGLLIRSVLNTLVAQEELPSDAINPWFTLYRFPRRAGWVAILSVLFGVVYFGGKFLPDAFFFWQRTVMSMLEVIVILSFLGFLVAFAPFLGIWAVGFSTSVPTPNARTSTRRTLTRI